MTQRFMQTTTNPSNEEHSLPVTPVRFTSSSLQCISHVSSSAKFSALSFLSSLIFCCVFPVSFQLYLTCLFFRLTQSQYVNWVYPPPKSMITEHNLAMCSVCAQLCLQASSFSVSQSLSPLSVFTADGWRQGSGRLWLMKYEMLGACLDYHRPLHLTHHNTQFTAERKSIHHTDLTRNMKIGWPLIIHVPPPGRVGG